MPYSFSLDAVRRQTYRARKKVAKKSLLQVGSSLEREVCAGCPAYDYRSFAFGMGRPPKWGVLSFPTIWAVTDSHVSGSLVFGGNHKWWRSAQDISTGYAKVNSSKIYRVRFPVKPSRFLSTAGKCSENIQYEVVSAVEFTTRGVIIVPVSIVDRYSHLGRIPIVEAISTPIVLVSPEILWVKDVRVVVEPVPIDGGVRVSPCAAICLLGLSFTRRGGDCERGHQEGQSPDLAEHGVSPCRM